MQIVIAKIFKVVAVSVCVID